MDVLLCQHPVAARPEGQLRSWRQGMAHRQGQSELDVGWGKPDTSRSGSNFQLLRFSRSSPARAASRGAETRLARTALTKTHFPGSRLQRELSVLILWVSFPSMRTRWLLPSSTATRIAPLLISTDTWERREGENNQEGSCLPSCCASWGAGSSALAGDERERRAFRPACSRRVGIPLSLQSKQQQLGGERKPPRETKGSRAQQTEP